MATICICTAVTLSDIGRRSCAGCWVTRPRDPASWTPRVLHASQTCLRRHGALITEVKGDRGGDLSISIPPYSNTIVLFGLTLGCAPWILSPLNELQDSTKECPINLNISA